MPSRSNAELMDKDGNRLGARRTVGPADTATRRRMLEQRLSEKQPAPSAAPPARAKRQPAPKRDLVRRYGPNGKTIDEIIGD